MGLAKYQRDGDPRTSGPGFALTVHPDALDVPRHWRMPRTVFVNSMSDLFHPEVPIGFIKEVFRVMAETPQHQYQVLTKRSHRLKQVADQLHWSKNIWMGVSIESARFRFRIDHLRRVPAAIRFLSLEPLLGSVGSLDLNGIHWVIAGGESGRVRRGVEADWIVAIRDQCLAAGVPFFFKQWGGCTPKAGGRTLDGRTWDQMPIQAEPVTRPPSSTGVRECPSGDWI